MSASERTEPTADSPESRGNHNGQRPKHLVKRFTDRGRERAVEQLHKVAQAVRDTGEHMGDEGGTLHGVMNKVADQIERMSEIARSSNPRDVVDAIERFARRDRALFLGSAVTLGIFTARFLRSSSRDQGKGGGRVERSGKEHREQGGQDDQGLEAKSQEEKRVGREETSSKRGASDDDEEEAHDEDEGAEEAVVEVRPSAELQAAVSEISGRRNEDG
jgi:hypothetical protein